MSKNEFMRKYSSHEFVKYDCELEEDVDNLLKQEREKVLAKVANLKNEYTDACGMCTRTDCDVCAISDFINQLENIISNE